MVEEGEEDFLWFSGEMSHCVSEVGVRCFDGEDVDDCHGAYEFGEGG